MINAYDIVEQTVQYALQVSTQTNGENVCPPL